ncbi:LOW QUALITY PROTEIN: metallophosphoesterase 1 homolog [Dendronephthya gigantea]|uniref:LOW QUALITY PROTEIN: metallophosphoesterase 1 homolog n=1 Tax=Dendronephthya gigantea TaxID=151771 RepID=UPI00106A9FD0|nr:LOW QUALITY PROTEIN: metallophosphoesterase 1 homolog [Dendronephthya gigantea]
MSWNVPVEKSKHDLRVLILSDPQMQGFQLEVSGIIGHITRWDACRYLKKTFAYALNQVKPDVVVILGDLLDEGYIASDDEFYQYKEWFEDIYRVPETVKRIHLAGDNDIGGEDEPLGQTYSQGMRNILEQLIEVIEFNKWQFLKLNTLSFLRYFRFSIPDEKIIYNNLNKYMKSSPQKLDDNKHTIVLSHLPLHYWDPNFAIKVLNNVNPRILFSGHDHKAKYRIYKLPSFTTEEHVVPTCSYRMGTSDIGIGIAILGEKGSFQYTVLRLPGRYSFLYFYGVVGALMFLYILFFRSNRST